MASNPPYVSAEEWADLAPEVRDHEPRAALVPAEGPSALYSRLFTAAVPRLGRGRWMAVEIGWGQEDLVAREARSAGLEVVEVRPDLQGVARVVVARRS